MKTESPAVTTADMVGVALLLVAAAAVTLTRCLLIPAAALLLAMLECLVAAGTLRHQRTSSLLKLLVPFINTVPRLTYHFT